MIDFSGDIGKRALERLQAEQIIWLTTTSAGGVPQPRPVWFLWDGSTFLIYSTPKAKKLEHVARNPNVALHFNSSSDGDDIQVFLASAEVLSAPTPAHQLNEYMAKYRDGITNIGMTPEQFGAFYTAAIRATPTKLRGV